MATIFMCDVFWNISFSCVKTEYVQNVCAVAAYSVYACGT